MKKRFPLSLLLISSTIFAHSQQGQGREAIKITGTVIDQETGQPLEYATLVLQSIENPDKVNGGITDIEHRVYRLQDLPNTPESLQRIYRSGYYFTDHCRLGT